MNKFILIGAISTAFGVARAQDAASKPASSPEMNELREQVKALKWELRLEPTSARRVA